MMWIELNIITLKLYYLKNFKKISSWYSPEFIYWVEKMFNEHNHI